MYLNVPAIFFLTSIVNTGMIPAPIHPPSPAFRHSLLTCAVLPALALAARPQCCGPGAGAHAQSVGREVVCGGGTKNARQNVNINTSKYESYATLQLEKKRSITENQSPGSYFK